MLRTATRVYRNSVEHIHGHRFAVHRQCDSRTDIFTTYAIQSGFHNRLRWPGDAQFIGITIGPDLLHFNLAQISVRPAVYSSPLPRPSSQTTNTAVMQIPLGKTFERTRGIGRSASQTLNVTPITTSFPGPDSRGRHREHKSCVGVTVSAWWGRMKPNHTTGCTGSTTSDGSGNFALTNLPSAVSGPQ